jgi:allantoicase
MSDDFTGQPNLASRALGAGVVYANDDLFAARENLVTPGPPVHDPGAFGPRGKVYDGWETRRRRTPGNDLAIVRLGVRGAVSGVVVDTAYFVGNYPPRVSVDGVDLAGYPSVGELLGASWQPLVPVSEVRGDATNAFGVEGAPTCTHVRLTLHPDGGVARLRVHGEVQARLRPGTTVDRQMPNVPWPSLGSAPTTSGRSRSAGFRCASTAA